MRQWVVSVGLLALTVVLGLITLLLPPFLTAEPVENHAKAAWVDRQWSVQVAVDKLAPTAEHLQLNIMGVGHLQAHKQRTRTLDDGTLVWQGSLSQSGEPPAANTWQAAMNTLLLISSDRGITGSLRWEGHVFRLYHTGTRTVLEEVNPAKLPADEPADSPSTSIRPQKGQTGNLQPGDATIRVLVFASKNAAQAHEDIEALAQLAIEESNQTFNLSAIGLSFELAGFEPLDYVQSGAGNSLELLRLWRADDGYMDEVHLQRDALAADVVVLLVDTTNPDSCGVAAGITEEQAFAVVNIACIGVSRYTFPHEIGHIIGAAHDGGDGLFTYGHGYAHEPAAGPRLYTVMAAGRPGMVRLPYWSDPQREVDGIRLGDKDTADNRRLLEERKGIVAGFR
ncbi:M12 family metallo-peptidase [Pseudomonas sp. NY11955]|uniref:M12 family metallo-peptidase n=1 Tax=Pseudomonas sp. NY11955 TaxID=3400363 RepID=UPI003A8B016D